MKQPREQPTRLSSTLVSTCFTLCESRLPGNEPFMSCGCKKRKVENGPV